ncbi:MAG: hypothetical protein IJ804_02230, partial [Prevotella sp.]|nr:hypothetical protein [Prevotella sp.]
SFSIREASAIPQQEVNDFMAAWKFIFNDMTILSGLDTMELAKQCQQKLEQLFTRMTNVYGNIAQYPFAAPLKEAMAIVNEWKDIRDNAAFFKKVVADKDQAKDLMDKWKQILQFHDDQLSKYKEFVEFVRGSQYDFPELSADVQPRVQALKSILDDEWPIDKMPTYKKLVQEVKYNIVEKVKELKTEIINVYKEVFEILKKVAEQAGAVGYTVNENVLTSAVAPNSILALKPKLDTQSFYESEVKRIMSLVPQKPKPPVGPGKADGEPEPPKPMTKLISLKTTTTKQLKTAQDVDEYLAELRKQLMKYIDNGESILVK